MLEKSFDSKTVEPRLYEAWERSGAFSPRETGEPFSIVIPPPNVTGSLHVGHALNGTLQDVLARFERMRGKAVLWLPGTDHAGIATQMVVERQLAEAGNIGRREMGREDFVAKVWEWKAKSGGAITNQLRRLGASCDWSRERFTLDEGLSAAVRKVFVQLYNEGLIYRDKRLVNWHPELQTAVSDLEVENVEIAGFMWRLRYPVEGSDEVIVVATTRPETMFGDAAVAVHPEDERYKHLIGRSVRLPLADRLIPIIADEHADPEKGTGAVKITPAHDFNDFEVGKRHDLPQINLFTPDAKTNEAVPEAFRGLDRFVARKKVVEAMEAADLLEGVDPQRVMIPYDEKSKLVVIEPYLTDQWYVDAATLAKPAMAAVEDGRTVFEPKSWEKTYFEWLRNIRPWCISRQLWWGHRIPAWWGPIRDGEETNLNIEMADQVSGWRTHEKKLFVAETEAEALEAARGYYGRPVEVVSGPSAGLTMLLRPASGEDRKIGVWQDEDVLDTWFSSGLWPFSTLGWPEKTEDLKRFYPTSTLVTGFDIIFFWVARMMMLGLHFMDDVPFDRVFINALVRDAEGKKMSKSKGNVMDPLELVDDYGADALRFTLTAMSGQARDIKLSRQRIEGYRNFGTKLWNAARFAQMNECVRVEGFDPASVQQPINRWIRGETAKAAAEITRALEGCGFDAAANTLYRFVWNTFCDWYLEFAKPILNGDDEAARAETRATTAWALDEILKLLHPISPFLTEELWDKTAEFGAAREGLLITTAWPVLPESYVDPAADAEINWLVELITEVRQVRAEMNVPPGARIPLAVIGADAEVSARLKRHGDLIRTLGRLESIREADTPAAGSALFVVGETTGALAVADFIDVPSEKARLSKEIAALAADIDRTAKKLGNADFVARAPEEVVEENRERLTEAEGAHTKLSAALERLSAMA